MKTKPITVRVNEEAAHIFETASQEQRRKMELLISLQLTRPVREGRKLEAVMSDMSRHAQAQGLTPEILESILNE